MDEREVTVRQYRKFLASQGNRRGTRYLNVEGYNDLDQPIVGVTLQQALAYARWVNKSIPNEREWYAAAALHWKRDGARTTLEANYQAALKARELGLI